MYNIFINHCGEDKMQTTDCRLLIGVKMQTEAYIVSSFDTRYIFNI